MDEIFTEKGIMKILNQTTRALYGIEPYKIENKEDSSYAALRKEEERSEAQGDFQDRHN